MASREAGTEPPESAGMVVLLVDDEPDVASVTAVHLERHLEDVAVATETGGEAALSRFSADVDCVVSDYEMPGIDGLELLRRVRDRDPDLPFILFTARGSEEIASEAISAGVTDYLQKGVGTDQYAVLANRIENAVERRRSQAAVAETRTRYRRLVEHSPNAIFVHDGDAILYANDRGADLVGVADSADLSGRNPLEFMHPDDVEDVTERIATIFEDGEMTDWSEYRIVREDGEVRHVETRGAPVQYEGLLASQVVLRDLTDVHSHEHRLESLHEATRRYLTAGTPEEIGAVTVDALETIFTDPIVVIWRYDDGTSTLEPLTGTERPREEFPDDFEDELPSMPDWSIEARVFRDGEPRLVTDYADQEGAVSEGLSTVYLFPLNDHGLLAVAWEDPHEITDAGRDLVGILARTLIVALDRVLDES